jgi:hypothetical protein
LNKSPASGDEKVDKMAGRFRAICVLFWPRLIKECVGSGEPNETTGIKNSKMNVRRAELLVGVGGKEVRGLLVFNRNRKYRRAKKRGGC